MRYLIIALLLVHFPFVFSQNDTDSYKFRVYLKDKLNAHSDRTEPLSFLSQKALDRRESESVEIDSTDYPVSAIYKQKIENQGVDIVSQSKWFNTLVVQCIDSAKACEIANLYFVDSVQYVWKGQNVEDKQLMRPRLRFVDCKSDSLHQSQLGISESQFKLHNAQHLFNAGFKGQGIDVAVIDAGFTNIDVIPLFLRTSFIGFKNFVPDGRLFSASDHGTRVVSTMGINKPNKVMGSAPQASYLLLRSEDERSEFPVEEDYWVAAIEYADSVGVKLVNTSLGYSQFDDSTLNYTHKELTGRKSLISRAADLAFDKGMLIVGSAGNEGNKSWQKITVPGDSEKMITVGAIHQDSTIVSFSSRGPSADGRIKPDFVSIGKKTVTVNQRGEIGFTNGTSFSSPFLAGLIASLWSVNPSLNRHQVLNIVRHSAHQFHCPDSTFGYGIPDFKVAYQNVLKTLEQVSDSITTDLMNVRKTANGYLIVALHEPMFQYHSYLFRIIDSAGSVKHKENFNSSDIVFELTDEIRKENNELYIVVESPLEQDIVRFKI